MKRPGFDMDCVRRLGLTGAWIMVRDILHPGRILKQIGTPESTSVCLVCCCMLSTVYLVSENRDKSAFLLQNYTAVSENVELATMLTGFSN